MSPHVTEDDGTMQLFEGLDADTPADLMRQQNSSNISYAFGTTINKSQSFEDADVMAGSNLTPESSLQDSVSNSSNERDSFGEGVRLDVATENGTNSNNWTIPQQHQFQTRAPDVSNLEDSNRVMENHFDFDSAASSPGAEVLEATSTNRHIAIPAEQSPMSVISPSIENVGFLS